MISLFKKLQFRLQNSIDIGIHYNTTHYLQVVKAIFLLLLPKQSEQSSDLGGRLNYVTVVLYMCDYVRSRADESPLITSLERFNNTHDRRLFVIRELLLISETA